MVWKKESARRTGEDWRESDLEREREEAKAKRKQRTEQRGV